MRKTLATLLAIPMLLFGVAFAGSMDQPGAGRDTGVASPQSSEDSSSAIDQESRTEASGEYKAPEVSTKSGLPDWLEAPFKGESPDASPESDRGGS